MKRLKNKIMTALLLATLLSQTSGQALFPMEANVIYAQEEMAGAGTVEEPFQISTIGHLSEISENLDKHFILTTDLNMEGEPNWKPIGSASKPFTGTLDGNGHKISNLTMYEAQNGVGLFSHVNAAHIKGLTLENVNVYGINDVGAIAGTSSGTTTIEDCHVTGIVRGNEFIGGLIGNYQTANGTREGESIIKESSMDGIVDAKSRMGGIVGYFRPAGGSIENCYTRGSIQTRDGSNFVGGIVGYLIQGDVKQSFNTADIISIGYYVGGIAGYAINYSNITECFNLAHLEGRNYVGGISGSIEDNALILNTYNRGDIGGNGENVGGITGAITTTLANSYSSGTIGGRYLIGGLYGRTGYKAIIRDSVTMAENVDEYDGLEFGRVGGHNYQVILSNNYAYEDMHLKAGYITQHVKGQNQQNSTKNGFDVSMQALLTEDFYIDTLGWDFDDIWVMPTSRIDYPIFKNIDESLQEPIDSLGSKRNPYLIACEDDLKNIPVNGMKYHYKVVNDIVIESETWTPLGSESNPFKGVLDGNGYKITNLRTEALEDSEGTGLFVKIAGATIKDLTIEGCDINGTENTGAIAGSSYGSSKIENCVVTGTVNGTTNVGGLFGQFTTGDGVIVNSYMEGAVNGETLTGGLVGDLSQGHILYSYNKADVTGTVEYTGGIAGRIADGATIKESINFGRVKGTTYVGGIVGSEAESCEISDSYNRGDVSGTVNVGGIAGHTAAVITRTYTTGKVYGESFVGGVYGASDLGSEVSNSAAINEKVIEKNASAYGRVAGQSDNTVLTNNVAFEDMMIIAGAEVQDIKSTNPERNSKDGGNTTNQSLLEDAIYIGELAWNFDSVWRMPDDVIDYPILRNITEGQIFGPADVAGVFVFPESVKMDVDDKVALMETILPLNASNKAVTWTSSDETVAVVDENGIVTATGYGTATITVTTEEGGFSAECEIEVVEPDVAVEGIELNETEAFMYVGDTLQLIANVLPENATNKNVTWTSSDRSVAVVNKSGLVIAIDAGTLTVTAITEDGEFEAYCHITVEELEKKPVNLALNKTLSSDSVSGSNLPGKAADGRDDTRWTAKSNSSNVVLVIDFMDEVTFNQVKLQEYGNRINDFKLQYFSGTKWVDFHAGTIVGENFKLDLNPITTTQIRLLVVSTKGAYGASICEFEVYNLFDSEGPAEPGDPENLALSKVATSSHSSGSNVAKYATDGDLSTRWGATRGSVGATLEVDFREKVAFNQVKIFEAYERVGDYRLQYWDGKVWVDCYTGTGIGEQQTADFDTVQSDKVRLQIDSLVGANGASIYEFEVYNIQ